MSRSVWLLLAVLAVIWITTSAEAFSTRKPDSWDDGEEDDNEDANQDDDDDDEEPELLISSLLTSPYLTVGEGGEYEGVIPDLLKAICETGHMSCDYKIVLVADGRYGSRDNQGHWTGMIGEVKRGEVDFAAAPLKITNERLAVVNFSVPFAKTALTIVVNKDDDVHTIDDILTKELVLGGTVGSAALEKLRNEPKAPYSTMWSAIESKDGSKVADMDEATRRVLDGGYAFVTETDTARFLTSVHCSLTTIDEAFLPDDGHAFAFPKDNDGLEPHVSEAITSLREDGTVDEIYGKWFASTCGAAAVRVLGALLLSALVVVFVL